MKQLVLVATLTALFLSACGGGDAPPAPSKDAPPAPSKLAAYVGTWVGACQHNVIETIAVTDTPGVKDSITYSATEEYFEQEGCAGAVIATGQNNSNFTTAHTGSADAGVVFTFGSASVMSKIDLVSNTQPAYVHTVTGPSVVHTTSNGTDTYCMAGGFCTSGQGTVAAQAPVSGGLYYKANIMYVLVPSGSEYKVDLSYTKK